MNSSTYFLLRHAEWQLILFTENLQGSSVNDGFPFPGDGSTAANTSTQTLVAEAQPMKRSVSLLKPIDTSGNEPEPDLLVLGFQELDLSTEALIYSTSTAKEDAWCAAVFAALGEKGELYEKVRETNLLYGTLAQLEL